MGENRLTKTAQLKHPKNQSLWQNIQGDSKKNKRNPHDPCNKLATCFANWPYSVQPYTKFWPSLVSISVFPAGAALGHVQPFLEHQSLHRGHVPHEQIPLAGSQRLHLEPYLPRHRVLGVSNIMSSSRFMTFEVVISLYCSHDTTFCLVIRNLKVVVVCTQGSGGGGVVTHYKIFYQEGIFDLYLFCTFDGNLQFV